MEWWEESKGWEKKDPSLMEYAKECEPSIFISDEVVNNDQENEKVNERSLLEKGEKVTDLGKCKTLA